MSGALVSTVVVGFAVVVLLAATSRWAYARLRREFMDDTDAALGGGSDEGEGDGGVRPPGHPVDGGRDGGGLITDRDQGG